MTMKTKPKYLKPWQLLESPIVVLISYGAAVQFGIWYGLIVCLVLTVLCHFLFGRK